MKRVLGIVLLVAGIGLAAVSTKSVFFAEEKSQPTQLSKDDLGKDDLSKDDLEKDDLGLSTI